MNNKNISFNHTLEEYNKKYRNRKYRLLKFTKKELEELDKKDNSNIKYHLLKDRKWWFIKDTYYEIPKPIRFTWFRNLNAACQVGTCLLLAGGVVATSIAVPLVLLNQNKGPSITIDGADYDIEASHIELHKDSYIVLKEKEGKSISDVEEVKIGGKVITRDTEWTFNKENKKVNIKAKAMTSTKIEIKVKTEEPTHVVTKAEWIAKADELVLTGDNALCNSKLEYKSNQLTYKDDGKAMTITSFEYSGSGKNRKLKVGFGERLYVEYGSDYSGTSLDDDGYLNDKGVYEVYEDEIVYTYNDETDEDLYKELHINKYGYPTYEKYADDYLIESIWDGDPKEPEVKKYELKFIANGTYYIPDAEDPTIRCPVQLGSGKTYKFWLNVHSGDTGGIAFFLDYNSPSVYPTSNYIKNVKITLNSKEQKDFTLVEENFFGINFSSIAEQIQPNDTLEIAFDVIKDVTIKPGTSSGK